MVQVHIHARLVEGVHGRAGGAGCNGPSFQVLSGWISQIAAFPHIVAVTADQVRIRKAVGLRVVEHDGFAHFGGHGLFARVGVFAVAKHDMAGNQLVHDFLVVGHGFGSGGKAFEIAFFIPGQVEVLLANVIGLVVRDGFAVLVFQAAFGQHGNGTVHAMHHVPGNHGAARSAVVHEGAGLGGLPAHHHFLAGLHVGQLASAQSAGGSVEVNVVNQLVLGHVLERQLNIVAFVHDDHRAGHGAIESKSPHEHARLDFNFFFLNRHFHLHHARGGGRFEGVLRHVRRSDQRLLDALELVDAGRSLDDFIARQAARGGHNGISGKGGRAHQACANGRAKQ